MEPPRTNNLSFLDHLREKLPPDDFVLFDALFQALNSREGTAKLDELPAWRTITPMSLGTAWPDQG